MISSTLFVGLRQDIEVNIEKNIIRLIKKKGDGKFEILLYMSKKTAVILSLFDGNRTVAQVIDAITSLFNVTIEKAKIAVYEIIETYQGQLVLSDKPIKSSIISTKEVLMCKAIEPARYLSPIVRRKIQRLVLFITDGCAANCVYCCIGDSVKHHATNSLTLEQIENLLIQAKDMNIPEVEITGGDPLVHKDIVSILEIVIKYGFKVYISTKIPITSKMADEFKRIGLKHISLSVDTIDSDTYEKLVGIEKKHLINTLAGMKNLNECGISFTVKTTITSLNIKQIPQMIEKIYSNYNCTNYMLQAYSRGDCYVKQLFASKSDYIYLDEAIDKLSCFYDKLNITKAYNIEKIIGSKKYLHASRMICMAGKNAITIYSNGKYGFCAHSMNDKLTYGDIEKMSLRDSWYSKELFDFLKPSRNMYTGTKCEHCNDFEECNNRRCYVRTLLEFNELRNIDPLCPYSEIDF